MEVDFDMTTNIMETLPWIDYEEIFTEIEERGKAEGKAERDMEIALKAFAGLDAGNSLTAIVNTLKELGIPDHVIEAVRRQQVKAD